jgi:nitrate reductase cytochrome c-type subunit
MWYAYASEPPDPIELYQPYENRECLHCHENARSFLQHAAHQPVMQKLTSGEVSCLLCHGRVHEVKPGAVREAVTGERQFSLPVEVEQQRGARWLH